MVLAHGPDEAVLGAVRVLGGVVRVRVGVGILITHRGGRGCAQVGVVVGRVAVRGREGVGGVVAVARVGLGGADAQEVAVDVGGVALQGLLAVF